MDKKITMTDDGSLQLMSKYEGTKGTYEIFGDGEKKPLVETETFNLYVAKLPSGQLGLMMIAKSQENNNVIQKQTNIIATLQEMALTEEETAEIKPHYGTLFPTMVETLMTDESDSRMVLFMGYDPAISTYKQLVPLTVALKDQRIDLQTGLWFLGKYMKLLDFVHVVGFTIGLVDKSNWLVETDLHGVFVLNWLDAKEGSLTNEDINEDIKSAAKIVWQAAGGTDENDPLYDEDIMSVEGHAEFVTYLKYLMSNEIKSADKEMITIYEMADRLWERVPDPGGYNPDGKKRPFHNWVVYPMTTTK